MKKASGKILAKDNRFIWKAIPKGKKNCSGVEKKRPSVDSVLCMKSKMPMTFWKCRQLGEMKQLALISESCLSQQGLKQRPHNSTGIVNTSPLQKYKCAGLQHLLRRWLSGRFGLGGTWRRSPCDETLYPRGIPPQRRENWKDYGCTIAIHGCSNLAVLYKEREEPDIEQEAEKWVYFCFKSKVYCLGDKMWTVLLWNDCVDECVCISTVSLLHSESYSWGVGGVCWLKVQL